jgi:hypothetical protein
MSLNIWMLLYIRKIPHFIEIIMIFQVLKEDNQQDSIKIIIIFRSLVEISSQLIRMDSRIKKSCRLLLELQKDLFQNLEASILRLNRKF